MNSSNSTKTEAELVKCWKFPFSCLTLKSDRLNKEQLSKASLEGLGFKWSLFSRIIISPLDQLGSVYSMLSEFPRKECTSLDQIQVFGILKVGECLHRIRSSLHGTVPLGMPSQVPTCFGMFNTYLLVILVTMGGSAVRQGF